MVPKYIFDRIYNLLPPEDRIILYNLNDLKNDADYAVENDDQPGTVPLSSSTPASTSRVGNRNIQAVSPVSSPLSTSTPASIPQTGNLNIQASSSHSRSLLRNSASSEDIDTPPHVDVLELPEPSQNTYTGGSVRTRGNLGIRDKKFIRGNRFDPGIENVRQQKAAKALAVTPSEDNIIEQQNDPVQDEPSHPSTSGTQTHVTPTLRGGAASGSSTSDDNASNTESDVSPRKNKVLKMLKKINDDCVSNLAKKKSTAAEAKKIRNTMNEIKLLLNRGTDGAVTRRHARLYDRSIASSLKKKKKKRRIPKFKLGETTDENVEATGCRKFKSNYK